MASSRDKDEVAASLSKLNLDIKATKKVAPASKQKVKVVDSWDDDDEDDDEDPPSGDAAPRDYPAAGDDVDDEPETPSASRTRVPSPPPPTPIDPRYAPVTDWDASFRGADLISSSSSSSSARDLPPSRRPEKTDAVARRMIAAGLGLKAPRQTEEQKAYQRSIREQERKRREQEKEQEKRRLEEVDRAKAAVWDD
ncbi:Mitochondrial oxaloacetate transport protein [Purpureocillium lavendulum]|uniref:Mitochondrial oxaloacetate transport protein n=1 Tax=Purpureocillium lavendulum TaxID=1247861 RepID=A0AB34G8H9_9HYPO|nr:Mitochondrial oxaloacetate transport protein [Purpureocillium lavendulum]